MILPNLGKVKYKTCVLYNLKFLGVRDTPCFYFPDPGEIFPNKEDLGPEISSSALYEVNTIFRQKSDG